MINSRMVPVEKMSRFEIELAVRIADLAGFELDGITGYYLRNNGMKQFEIFDGDDTYWIELSYLHLQDLQVEQAYAEAVAGVDYDPASCPSCDQSDCDFPPECQKAVGTMPSRPYPHHDEDE